MNTATLGKFLAVTIGLTLGLGVVMAAAYRANIAAHWEERRCEPGVVPIAGAFKPATDPRTAGEFAKDNWRECQKEYIQRAVAAAAEVPKELAAAQGEVVAAAEDVTSFLTDVFVDVWQVCYEAYSTFMDRIHGAAKLFQNSLVQMHSIIGRMQASLLAIVYALISSIMAFVDSVKITLIVAIIVIGILIGLQIILFFLFLPISGLIITMTFVLSMVIVSVATAIAAAMVSELFVPGACFRAGTRIAVSISIPASTNSGAPRRSEARPIEAVRIGDELHGGGRVTAVHRFLTRDPVYDVHGVHVTGDHLIYSGAGGQLMPVREYPDARIMPRTVLEILRHGGRVAGAEEVWCLTTTNRRIPCVGSGGAVMEFADWEEIPDDAEDQQRAWHTAVQQALNGETASAVDSVVSEMSESEAALHPHAEVLTREGGWMRVSDVRLGEQIRCGDDVWATVLGRVEMTPDVVESTTADGVSTGCWVWNEERRLWSQPAGSSRLSTHTDHWIHLYTSTGTVRLRGPGGGREVLVRDASDVGLERIGAINDAVVLKRTPLVCPKNRHLQVEA